MAKEDSKKQDKTPSIEDLQKQIEDLKAKLVEGEEGALKRVAKHMGVDPSEVADKETTPVDDLVEVDMASHIVPINGTTYRGVVQVPRAVAQVIHQAIGDKRMRLLREMTGKDYVMEEVAGGRLRAKVVGQVNAYGEKI